MRVAYFDCFAGITGELLLGALLDAGLPLDSLRDGMARFPSTGYTIEAQQIVVQGIAGTQVVVVPLPAQRLFDTWTAPSPMPDGAQDGPRMPAQISARGIPSYLEALARADLPDEVKRKTAAVLDMLPPGGDPRLPGAQYGANLRAADGAALLLVTSCVYALALLGVESAVCSPINVGGGTMPAHGIVPVPAPAILEILGSVSAPVYGTDSNRELTNGTGAALAAALAQSFGPLPAMSITKAGYGMAGAPTSPGMRVLLGELQPAVSSAHAPAVPAHGQQVSGEEIVAALEAVLEDTNPQYYDYIMERLLWQGALEVFLVPVQMKLNRHGVVLTVICNPADVDTLTECLFEETGAEGLRVSQVPRRKMRSETAEVQTQWGAIRVRVGRNSEGRALHVKPDYDDVKRVALEMNVPVERVHEQARAAWSPYSSDGHQQAGRQREVTNYELRVTSAPGPTRNS